MPYSLLLSASLTALSPALAAMDAVEDAQWWLRRMVDAAEKLNYDGTFVYRTGDTLESMRIIHRVDEGGERERLVALSGAAREVLRGHGKVTCILPDDQAVLVSKGRTRQFLHPERFAEKSIPKHYQLFMQSGSRVAGRDTTVVSVRPIDEFRYGYRLALDQTTGLPLHSELLGNDGVALEEIVYTSLQLPVEIPDALLEPAQSGEGFTWYEDDPPAEAGYSDETQSWKVLSPPPGFELTRYYGRPSFATKGPVAHLVYSDGLASVSVFVEPTGPDTVQLSDSESDGQRSGLSSMGAVNAYALTFDGYQITVVGEVPSATVRQIAHSVIRRH